MASKRAAGRRGHRNKRGSSEKQGRGRLPMAIMVGLAAFALTVVGVTTFLIVDRSEHQERHGAVKSPGITSENASVGIAVGNKIPDFDIRLNNGNAVSAANLVEQGQPTFYFFFATW